MEQTQWTPFIRLIIQPSRHLIKERHAVPTDPHWPQPWRCSKQILICPAAVHWRSLGRGEEEDGRRACGALRSGSKTHLDQSGSMGPCGNGARDPVIRAKFSTWKDVMARAV
ncbi:hypothetical protein SKAU_G00069580 [Synaphobranchus kaupii]|uniref:Uncharacterized protein n=1 Tax=Synaphobranchus kaupii TaxID=118154 RepID=A0A9Q1G7D9_SYNKA|nr:hypothetical protein SKAU_G00069580 [Synaphobranchus kaupii]